MKNVIIKTCAAGLITLAMMSSASASWVCYMHNARGGHFYGHAWSRDRASAIAMSYCSSGSVYARNCVLDYCERQ